MVRVAQNLRDWPCSSFYVMDCPIGANSTTVFLQENRQPCRIWMPVRSIAAKFRGKKGPAHDHAAFFLFFEN
ncbi:MAG: hypothetical protein DMG34_07605 [Acidobacteria bacterium]|nr:MAG: hypothetical protein DMG34_07605 [Acidobacteriota bacterium]